jgi:hypothetical protein
MGDIRQTQNPQNWLEEPRKLPSTLNVVSILTFIGCVYIGCTQIYSFFMAQKSYERMVAAQDKLDNMPEFMKKFMGPDMVEVARLTMENRVPILLLTLVGIALCVYGAIMMRRLKKLGFYIYVIGELLPIVTAYLFAGLGLLGGIGAFFAIFIPVVFIIMYATQLKYLSQG